VPKSVVPFIDSKARELVQRSIDRTDRAILDRTETVWTVEKSRESIARSRRLIAALEGRHRGE